MKKRETKKRPGSAQIGQNAIDANYVFLALDFLNRGMWKGCPRGDSVVLSRKYVRDDAHMADALKAARRLMNYHLKQRRKEISGATA